MSVANRVVLDACVLVNAALRDTMLRLAEPPSLYLPLWSAEILDETQRTMENKLGVSRKQTSYLISEMNAHFADSVVEDYSALLPALANHEKDRHVLAAAVRAGAQTIVTFNLRHFPPLTLASWQVEARSPDDFLVDLFDMAPAIVTRKLIEQAERHQGMARLLEIHGKTVPKLVARITERLEG
jgi:predicted nucleic acid-binding protein